MNSKVLQIALLLTAVDNMSNVVNNAVANVDKAMQKIKHGAADVMAGVATAMSGKMLYDNTIAPMTGAFTQIQDHATNLRIAMMRDGGAIDENFYKKLSKSSEVLSEKFGTARSEYLDMFKILKSNHFSEVDMLGDVGENMAAWSRLMETSPVSGTGFMSGLKNDLKLSNTELIKMMDLVQRLHYNEGIGKDGQDAMEQLKESFSVASLGMTNLKYTGFEAARDFSALLVPFLRRKIAPETMGTGFRKIWANMLDVSKMNEFNSVAATFGKKFTFFDKDGNFLGLQNFMKQMDLFKGMSMPDINTILMPLTGGKTGLSSDVFKILAQEGSKGFNEGMQSIYSGGDMYSRLAERMSQVSVQEDRLSQMWQNAKYHIGVTLIPMLIKVIVHFAYVVHAIKEFAKAHPHITSTVFKIIGLVSAIMVLSGVILMVKGSWLLLTGAWGGSLGLLGKIWNKSKKIVDVLGLVWESTWFARQAILAYTEAGAKMVAGGVISFLSKARNMFSIVGMATWGAVRAAWAWTMALLANPMTLIILGIIVAVALLAGAVYLIVKNWKHIVAFFKEIWASVKLSFVNFVSWIKDIGSGMWNAGKNIVMSVYNGIKSVINKPIEAMREMVQKIRNMLPFSPAKEGPLRDIHKIRLIETISENIKPASMIEKMRSVASSVMNFSPNQYVNGLASPNPSVSGGISVNFAPVYNGKPGANFASDKDDFMAFMNNNKRQLVDILQDELKSRASRNY